MSDVVSRRACSGMKLFEWNASIGEASKGNEGAGGGKTRGRVSNEEQEMVRADSVFQRGVFLLMSNCDCTGARRARGCEGFRS